MIKIVRGRPNFEGVRGKVEERGPAPAFSGYKD